MEEELKNFIDFMKVKVTGKDPCEIINTDQSAIHYSFHPSKPLKNRGTRMIHVHMSTTNTK